MKNFLLLSALAAGLVAAAAQETVTKTASGTASATVTFDGRTTPLRVTTLDVTSDKAGSVALWRYGNQPSTIARSAASGVSNVVVATSSIASNEVVLIQQANGNVLQRTVSAFVQTPVTNTLITFGSVLGTNLASGDTFSKRLAETGTQQFQSATNATRFLLSSVAGLAQGDQVMAQLGGVALVGVVTNAANTVTNRTVPLRGALDQDLPEGVLVWERLTNRALVAGAVTAVTTNIYTKITNGFAPADVLHIVSASGKSAVRTLWGFSTSNLIVNAPLGFTLTTDDVVFKLSGNYTNMTPAAAGTRSIVLNGTNSLAVGDMLLIGTNQLLLNVISGAASVRHTPTLDLTAALGRSIPAGVGWHKLTNTFRLADAATRTAFIGYITNIVLNPTVGDVVVMQPATGGNFLNTVTGVSTNQTFQSLRFTASHGVALAAGDVVYATTTNSTPVGAATLRLVGDAVMSAPVARPASLTLDGTSTCTINNVTVRY